MNRPHSPKRPRAYIAKRLLEHGPLTLSEFREITGWPTNDATQALFQLADSGVVRRFTQPGTHHYVYGLAQ
jgi:DNA-binding transcriptional regulator GbsR (MarR family)